MTDNRMQQRFAVAVFPTIKTGEPLPYFFLNKTNMQIIYL